MSVYVDIPTVDCIGNSDGAFKNVAVFKTRSEAIAFCIAHFGGDEQGRVQLVTGEDSEDELSGCEVCDVPLIHQPDEHTAYGGGDEHPHQNLSCFL